MAQFSVYANSNKDTVATHPYLLDIQHEIVRDLDTRLVIPLVNDIVPMEKLHPQFEIEGALMILSTTEMASVPLSMLGREIDDLSSHRRHIMNAVDFLMSGF